MVKTFREVLRDIKPGETWICTENCIIRDIRCYKDGMIETTYTTFSQSGMFCVDGKRLFKLKKNEVEFEDAVKALKEGKIIESCETERMYKVGERGNEKAIFTNTQDSSTWLDLNNIFKQKEVLGRWYIYDKGEIQ